ncbi:Lysophospholipase D gdpd1 [Geranomyces variabilis]|uniref:Lysophospholipase D gdpd1 n=1 Tax=Geranomyces variabilis TaxID=109894 RepID=A0AAD5TES7_9FUNG|nr:Lysophospholipase D gdpd1 [Geranomyces variabilis]
MGSVTSRQPQKQQLQRSPGLPFNHALMSHRGGSLEHVENTLPAFRYSANVLKADLLELDCYLTKDDQVVIFHDLTLKRMCGLEGKTIGDYDYKDLPPLLVQPALRETGFEPTHPDDTRIPLLSELLDEFPTYPMQIDVKLGSERLVQKLGTMIRERQKQQTTVWGSFRNPQNAWCKTHFPDIPRFFALRRLFAALCMYSVGMIHRMEFDEAALIMPNVRWLMWPGFARALNERGIPVIVFGVPGGGANTVEVWEQIRAFGANGICSDRPTALQEWLKNNPLRVVEQASALPQSSSTTSSETLKDR